MPINDISSLSKFKPVNSYVETKDLQTNFLLVERRWDGRVYDAMSVVMYHYLESFNTFDFLDISMN